MSRPRRIAAAPDGSLWVAYYGNGRLARLDPGARRITGTWALPKEGGKGAYAVTVDGAGRVWVNGIDTDTVSLFDPVRETFRVIALPSKDVGIRKAIIDRDVLIAFDLLLLEPLYLVGPLSMTAPAGTAAMSSPASA